MDFLAGEYICNSPRRVYEYPVSLARTLGALRYKERVTSTGNVREHGAFIFMEIKFGVYGGWVVCKNKETKEEYFTDA